MQHGSVSVDTWVLTEGQVDATTLLPKPLAPSMSAEVVGGGVSSDAKQPRHRAGVAGFEAAVRLVCIHEDLRGDVLSVSRRRDLRSDIGVYATEVVAIQVFERRPIGEHGRFMVLASTLV